MEAISRLVSLSLGHPTLRDVIQLPLRHIEDLQRCGRLLRMVIMFTIFLQLHLGFTTRVSCLIPLTLLLKKIIF